MSNYLGDGLVLIGCALILVGVWQISPLATWFVGGGMLIVIGVVVELGQRSGK